MKLAALVILGLAASAASASEFYDVSLSRRRTLGAGLLGAALSGGGDEAVARDYIGSVVGAEAAAVPDLMGKRPFKAPDLALEKTVKTAKGRRILRFGQTIGAIPVFGADAVVELDEDGKPISLNARFAKEDWTKVEPKLSAGDAVAAVAQRAKPYVAEPKPARPPRLYVFHDPYKRHDRWHLAYLVERMPAAPADYDPKQAHKDAFGASRLTVRPPFNFLVDAEDGAILLAYRSDPMLVARPTTPTKSQGVDEDDHERQFYSLHRGDDYVLDDPMRHIRTVDMKFRSPIDPLTDTPTKGDDITNATPEWAKSSRAAVSAQANITKVWDFYNDVVERKGILDSNDYILAEVNCIDPDNFEPSPEWHNAAWIGDRMIYGQVTSGGRLRSWARFVDVTGHELTHGVIHSTFEIFPCGQSGALDESLADIMGILIKNWDPDDPKQDVSTFNWEIGSGLGVEVGRQGGPLRDLSDPRKTGDPDNMSFYKKLACDQNSDEGGRHLYASIHNKAAYNLLTARDAQGRYLIPWKDAAMLFYQAMLHLTEQADFLQMRQQMLDAAAEYYRIAPDRQAKLKAIAKAYADVGIGREE